MPRARRTAVVEEFPLPVGESEGLRQDPPPSDPPARRGRPRKAAGGLIATKTTNRAAARASNGRVMSKADMVAKVTEELRMWAELALMPWEIRDPECAATMRDEVTVRGHKMERIDAIVERAVAMVSRNPRLLAILASSGIVGEAIMLGTLLKDPVRQWMRVHGPGGIGHVTEGEAAEYADRFPVWQGAAAG